MKSVKLLFTFDVEGTDTEKQAFPRKMSDCFTAQSLQVNGAEMLASLKTDLGRNAGINWLKSLSLTDDVLSGARNAQNPTAYVGPSLPDNTTDRVFKPATFAQDYEKIDGHSN